MLLNCGVGEDLRVSCTAAAAAESLQSCLTLCDPIDGSPPGSPVPGILQARVLEWSAIAFSVLYCKEIQPVNSKGNQSWIFIGRTDAKTEIPILWPPDEKKWLIGKDPDAGKDWRQEDRGWQRMRSLDGITESMDMSLSKFWELVMYWEAWNAAPTGLQEVRHDWTTKLSWK